MFEEDKISKDYIYNVSESSQREIDNRIAQFRDENFKIKQIETIEKIISDYYFSMVCKLVKPNTKLIKLKIEYEENGEIKTIEI